MVSEFKMQCLREVRPVDEFRPRLADSFQSDLVTLASKERLNITPDRRLDWNAVR